MSTTTTPSDPLRPGYRLVFRPVITLKNGKKLHAASYGKKSWVFWVPDNDDKK